MLWYICKTLSKLPNDPLIQELKPLQLVWIIENMAQDAREQAAAMKGQNVSSQSFQATEDVVEFAKKQRNK